MYVGARYIRRSYTEKRLDRRRPGYCFDTQHSERLALARSRLSIRRFARDRGLFFFLVPRPVVDADRPRRQISVKIPHELNVHVYRARTRTGGVADLRSVTHVCCGPIRRASASLHVRGVPRPRMRGMRANARCVRGIAGDGGGSRNG